MIEYTQDQIHAGSIAIFKKNFTSLGIGIISNIDSDFYHIKDINTPNCYLKPLEYPIGVDLFILDSQINKLLTFEDGTTFDRLTDTLNQPYRINDYIVILEENIRDPLITTCSFGKIIKITNKEIVLKNNKEIKILLKNIIDAVVIHKNFCDNILLNKLSSTLSE